MIVIKNKTQKPRFCSTFSELGVTLFEVLISLALVGIMSGVAISNLRRLNTESQNAAAYVSSFLKQVRARAIASTLAYRVRPSSSTRIVSETATTCSAITWTLDARNRLDLPTSTYAEDTSWDICFNSRGFPDGNLEIFVRESNGTRRKVEIMLGGAIRVT